jgi:hypothetical protein
MISCCSAVYDGARAAWDAYLVFFRAITPKDIIPLVAPFSIAIFAYFQWRINLESSRRYFSDRLLESYTPIQSAYRLAFKMLSAQGSYNKNLEFNRESEEHDQSNFMMEQKERIKQYACDLEKALAPADDSMFALSLLLGLHRPETPTAARKLAKDIHDKAFELLRFAQQCKAEIIEHGYFEINGKPVESIINMPPHEAITKLNRLHIELINLLTSQYKVSNI